MIKKIFGQISKWKVRTQFAVLILCAMLLSFWLFFMLWMNKWRVLDYLGLADFYFHNGVDIMLTDALYEQAKNYELPESEDDKERIQALDPLFDLADDYTTISFYGADDGLYRASRPARIMEESGIFSALFYLGYRLTDGEGEDFRYFPLEFSNGRGNAFVLTYRRSIVVYPFALICLIVSVLFFFFIVLFFINRKIRSILALEREVLVMSSGDLSRPVPDLGGDEIGILAKELNNMRMTLNDNIEREQESRQANQDLITALSHDLRTPLTILNGYLEVIKLKKNPKLFEEYVDRCLKKTKDIKELTDRMFEYALVSEENETPEITYISADFIRQCLQENADFIKLAGFQTELSLDRSPAGLKSDKTMIKRILSNLFSNIFKYGDKKETVLISFCMKKDTFTITIENAVKQEHSPEDNNNIGLKSVRKMIRLLDGEIFVSHTSKIFTVRLTLGRGV